MPTVISKTVKPSGGDYSSLNAAFAAVSADLVSADEQWDIACYSMTDTTIASLAGKTTDATHYVRVYTPSTERHNGTRSSGKYLLKANGGFGAVISCSVACARFEGLQVSGNGGNSSALIFINTSDAGADIRITDTLVYDNPSNNGSIYGVGIQIHQCPKYALNNVIVMNCKNPGGGANADCGSGILAGTGSPSTGYAYNCASVNNGDGGVRGYGFRNVGGLGSLSAKNCYAGGNNVADFGSSITKTTCHAADTSGNTQTAFSTSTGAKFANVTPGSEDLTPGSGSALLDVGTDLSADTHWVDPAGDVDIIGTSRPQGAGWDVGPFEFITASPPVNDVAPAVTGVPAAGKTLSCTTGTWTGDVSGGYTYQWKDGSGNITGATSSTYVVGAGEKTRSIHCTVTATGTGGPTSANSNTVGPVGTVVSLGDLRFEWQTEITTEMAAPPQYAFPSADSVDGNWLNELGTNANLYASISEPVANDATFIESESLPANSAMRVKIGTVTDPEDDTHHAILWRVGKDNLDGNQIDAKVSLYQGGGNVLGAGTLIATFTRTDVGSLTTYNEAIDPSDAANITDYSDLFLEFEANAP